MKCLWMLFLLCAVVPAYSAEALDLDILPRPANATVIAVGDDERVERIYPLDAVRRISGRLRYDAELMVAGRLRTLTYELPALHDAIQVFDHAREYLQSIDAQLLYWCRGRECGPSNLWANNIFGLATLYGLDDQQAYAVIRLAPPDHDSLLVLYGVTRGNRKGYLYVERLDASDTLGTLLPTAATLLKQLTQDGVLRLPVAATADSAWVDVLAQSLRQNTTMRIGLAGSEAESWREALIARDVRAARMELDAADVTGLRVQLLR